VLRHSDPAELRRAFVAVAGGPARRARAAPRARKAARVPDQTGPCESADLLTPAGAARA